MSPSYTLSASFLIKSYLKVEPDASYNLQSWDLLSLSKQAVETCHHSLETSTDSDPEHPDPALSWVPL